MDTLLREEVTTVLKEVDLKPFHDPTNFIYQKIEVHLIILNMNPLSAMIIGYFTHGCRAELYNVLVLLIDLMRKKKQPLFVENKVLLVNNSF